jgi:hypothetical protein
MWKHTQNVTCEWQELMPTTSPTGVRCGTQCFTSSLSGATCPRYGWLQNGGGCIGRQPQFWGPIHGNFFWRFYNPPFDQPLGDGDAKSDVAVYRPGTGEWLIRRSSDGGLTQVSWGGCSSCGDVPVPADYDGDSFSDVAVYRTGEWLIRRSSDGATVDTNWGCVSCGDIPVPADYNGDGRADIAVYRPTTGQWFVLRSSDGGVTQVNWGCSSCGDIPVPADYDGDAQSDIAVYRPSTAEWFILRSSEGYTSLVWVTPGQQERPVKFLAP